MTKSPEAVLRDDLKFAPLYDLNLQKKSYPRGVKVAKEGYMARPKTKRDKCSPEADRVRHFGDAGSDRGLAAGAAVPL